MGIEINSGVRRSVGKGVDIFIGIVSIIGIGGEVESGNDGKWIKSLGLS